MNRIANSWIMIKEGVRLLRHDLSKKKYKKYQGNAVQICKSIADDCWNGSYFKAGAVHLDQFWIRDLGWCIEDLLYLGYKYKLVQNLKWALNVYKLNGKISTTIFQSKAAVNIYTYSSDSLPYLLFCLLKSGKKELAAEYRSLLNKEIWTYYKTVFDKKRKTVANRYFSNVKDVAGRKRSCTDNTFMIFCAELLKEFEDILDNPFDEEDLINEFIKAFWTGKYFRNDLQDDEPVCSSDANVWPYWTGIINDEGMMKKSIDAIIGKMLDKPFPLKYHEKKDVKSPPHLMARLFMPNYQGDSIWTLHAPIFIRMTAKIYPQKARFYLKQYTEHIEKYRTYMEVFEPDGSEPLKGRFGHTSERAMLWACMIPRLTEELD